jgi:hypothetical protein
VNEGDPEGGGGVSQLVRTEGRAIVEINLSGHPPFAQSLDQAVGEVFKILLQIELPMGDEAGVVIQEGKEKTLAHLPVNDHRRPMHAVGLPDVIGEFRFIPSEIRFKSLWLVQSSPLEEPIQTLDGSMKVRSQKLSFSGHPEDHGQGGSFEFGLQVYQCLFRFFIQRSGLPFVRTLLRLETFNPAATVPVLLEPLQNRGTSQERSA